MLKALKIIGISLTGLIFLLGVVLYILEIKYRDAIHKKTIEIITQNFDEQFTFKDFHVSFLNRFPRLTVSVNDIEFKDSTKTLLQVGEVNFLVNLWELRNKNVVIDKITINNADLNFQVDSLGNKPHLLNKVKVKHDSKEHSVSFNLGKIYINNSKLLLGNYYKHNHTYIHIEKGIFQPDDSENDFRIEGQLEGFLDSLVTNDKALIRNQPIKLNDVVLNYNKKTKELVSEKGEIMAHSLTIYPHVKIKPVTDGSLIDLEISSQGNINEFLDLVNFHFNTKFTLESPNATLKFSFKQSGLVTPFLKPNSEIDFEVSDAVIKEEKLPYPVEISLLSGSYTNGDKHSAETSVIKIDTLHAKVQDSYFNGSITVENLADPHIITHINADIGLHHVVKDTNKLKLDGNIKLDAKYAGKVSELKKMHYSGYLAHMDFKNISIMLKEQKQTIKIPNASATLKNHFLEINDFKGTINGSNFHISAKVQNPLLHLLNSKEDLKAHLDIGFDNVNLASTKSADDGKNKTNPLESIRKIIMDHITTEISVKGNKLKFQNMELININLSGSQKTDNISFKLNNLGYADGSISGKGNFNLGKNGISDIHADFKGHLKNLDLILNKKDKTEQKKNQTFIIPSSTHINVQLLVDNTNLGPFILSKIDLASTLTNQSLDIKKLNMNIEKGKIIAKGNLTLDTAGFSGGNIEIGMDLVKVDMNKIISEFTNDNNTPDTNKNDNKLAALKKLTAKVNFAAKEFLYSDLLLTNLNTSFRLAGNQLNIDRLTGNLPFGAADITLTANDFLSDDRKLKSSVNLSLDTVNVDDILAMKIFHKENKKESSVKNKITPMSIAFTKNIDIKMNISAKQLQYKKAELNNLSLIMDMNSSIIDIKTLDFLFASGSTHLKGYLLNNGTQSYPFYVTSDIKNLNIQQVLGSFDNFNQTVVTPENTSGLFSWKSTHYLSFDHNLKINLNDNYWIFDFAIHDAELKEVEPVQNALFFIGHKSKSNMIIKDLNVRVSMFKDKIYFSEVIMNDNIANLEILGSYSLNDSLIDLSSKISLTDLLFRSKKERVLETQQGKISLDQDSKIFLQVEGNPSKHKFSIRSRKKTERFEKELKREIEKANKIFEQKEAERQAARL